MPQELFFALLCFIHGKTDNTSNRKKNTITKHRAQTFFKDTHKVAYAISAQCIQAIVKMFLVQKYAAYTLKLCLSLATHVLAVVILLNAYQLHNI